MKHIISIVLLFCFSTFFAISAERVVVSEKLYLQLESNKFNRGDTVFFKGYLQNASAVAEEAPSEFIYVELLEPIHSDNPQEFNLVQRVKVKRNGLESDRELGDFKIFNGYIKIPTELKNGQYLLRAYTRWQLNFPLQYLFNCAINIGDRIETVEAKDNITNPISVEFYPEGGKYFIGKMGVLVVKAYNKQGKGVKLQAPLLNGSGDTLQMVNCGENGYGIINFIPKEGEKYFFNGTPLPKVNSDGGTINLNKRKGNYYIGYYYKSNQNIIVADSLQVKLFNSMGLNTLCCIPINKKELESVIKIPDSLFCNGVNQLFLQNTRGNILSERIFFKFGSQSFEKSKSDDFQEDNLNSYMLLSSELKENIYNPKLYFDESTPLEERISQMDMLMISQKSSFVDIKTSIENKENFIPKEYSQSISGRIVGKNNVDRKLLVIVPKMNVTELINIGKEKSFCINNLDFTDSTLFRLSLISESKNSSSIIIDNEHFAPTFGTEYKYRFLQESGIIYRDDDTSSEEKNYELDAIVVSTTGNGIYRPKTTISPIQATFDIRQVRNRSQLEKYDFMTIPEYIAMSFTGFKAMNGVLFSTRISGIHHAVNAKGEPVVKQTSTVVKLYVDGVESREAGGDPDWSSLSGYYVKDIEELAVLRGHESVLYKSASGVVFISLNRVSSSRNGDNSSNSQNSVDYTPLGYQTSYIDRNE